MWSSPSPSVVRSAFEWANRYKEAVRIGDIHFQQGEVRATKARWKKGRG